MDAVEFLKQLNKMCVTSKNCEECGACKTDSSPYSKQFEPEKLISIVENWYKTHPIIELTEQQKTAIRGRIAEGWKWIANDKLGEIWFYEEKPKKDIKKGFCFNDSVYGAGQVCNEKISKIYDFVTFENSPLYLPDLLGGEE